MLENVVRDYNSAFEMYKKVYEIQSSVKNDYLRVLFILLGVSLY